MRKSSKQAQDSIQTWHQIVEVAHRLNKKLHRFYQEKVQCDLFSFPNARAVLEKVNDDLSRTLEKIEKSEKVINSNMSDAAQHYQSQSEELKKLSTHYNNLSASLKEMNENYRVVSEKLEQIQVNQT